MNTDHDVQDNQMQTNLVFELARVAREVLSYEQEMSLKVWKQSGFLERGQVKDDLKNRSASFALRVSRPNLRQDRSSDGTNDGSSANSPLGAVL